MNSLRRGVLLSLLVVLPAQGVAYAHPQAQSYWTQDGCPDTPRPSLMQRRSEAAEGALFACTFAVVGFTLFLGLVWLARMRLTRGAWRRFEAGRAPAVVDAGGAYREAGTVPVFRRGPPSAVVLGTGAVFLTLGPLVVRGVVLLMVGTTVSSAFMLLSLGALAATMIVARCTVDASAALLSASAGAPAVAARWGARMLWLNLGQLVLSASLASSVRVANPFERCIWLGVAATSVAALVAALLLVRAAFVAAAASERPSSSVAQ